MDMSLSKLRKLVLDTEAWHTAVHGITKTQRQLSNWTELNWNSFDYYSIVIYSWKSGYVMSPALFFLLKISLASQGFLWFYMNLRIIFSISVEMPLNFNMNCTESVHHFGCNEHFNDINSSHPWIQIISPFFASSSISFINILFFSVRRSSDYQSLAMREGGNTDQRIQTFSYEINKFGKPKTYIHHGHYN